MKDNPASYFEKKMSEFEAKLKPIKPETLEEVTTRKAKRAKEEADKVAKQAKETELQAFKGKRLLEGVAASPGIWAGTVRIVPWIPSKHPVPNINGYTILAKIKPGEVVVTERTEPEHEPYVAKAGAIITDMGGRFCPAAIAARRLGIPAVTGIGNATSILKDEQKVVVDGSEGVVHAYKEKIT